MDCDSLRIQASRPIVWSIAGNDCGGGAGLAADLLTIHDLGGHVCPVVSSVTAQNSLTLRSAEAVSAKILRDQLDVLAVDLPPVAIKIGLLPTIEHVALLADWLADFKAKQSCFVVLDPVVITSQGGNMAEQDIRDVLLTKLLPQLDLITPNLNELVWLLKLPADHFSSADYPLSLLEAASTQLRQLGVTAVLCKGGHFNDALTRDYFSDGTQRFVLESERVVTRHGHGTGCTLASAVAALVAQSYDITDALAVAKAYVQQGLRQAQGIGQGPGPVAHVGWPEQAIDFPQPRWVTQNNGVWQLEDSLAVAAFPETDHQLGLYPVVDSVQWIEKLLQWGVRTLQLRVKDPGAPDLEQQIEQAIKLGQQYQARLFINDYWQLAVKHGAYGVHLGQEDLQIADLNAIRDAGIRLGISTHGFFELARAFALQPSYIALGHIFPTQTKEMPSQPQGLQRLDRYVALACDFPTVAIGGISEARVPEVQVSGVGSIALVSAITKAADPQVATERLLRLMEGNIPEAVAYADMLSDDEFLRYGRQILLPEIGEAGQLKLKQSKALIVGLGGLGSPASLYLAAAGVGELWLADGDKVDSSNLQRQVLYRTADRHQPKTKAACAHLSALNPAVKYQSLPAVDEALLAEIVPQVDVVLDCSDNMLTRQRVNAACIRAQKPLITAAATGWEGQLLLIEPTQQTACYHCLFPLNEETGLSCREAGIVGPVVGMLGTAQALLAMQLLCDLPRPTGILQRFDGRTLQWQRLKTQADPTCPVCHSSASSSFSLEFPTCKSA